VHILGGCGWFCFERRRHLMKNNYGIHEGLAYGEDLTAHKSVPKWGNQLVCARTNLKHSVLVSVWSKSRYFLVMSERSNIWQIALIVVLSMSDFSRDAILLLNTRTSQNQRHFTSFISKHWRYTQRLCENRPQSYGKLTALHFGM